MVNDYVNSAAKRSREKKSGNSGSPKIIVMVGISFGLLCVLQSVLNISLRLRSEKDQPFRDKDLLLQENEKMEEKIRQLLITNQALQAKNKDLRDEVEILRNSDKRHPDGLEGRVVPLRCPQGWTIFRSSCYQISATTNTWDHAQRDCEQKGAHLVIFNDQEEEGVLYLFDTPIEMWIGLSAEDTCCCPSTWTWVDGARPTFNKWNGDNLNTGKRCAFLRNGPLLNWMEDNCLSFHNWICERKPSARKALPK